MNKIYLIGYMGCGKTTIGRLLAKQIGWSFVDMDTYIENRHQETISELFAKQGESFFRKAEHTSLEEISKSENIVVSTGGGTPCFFDNIDLMNRTGLSFYIYMSPKALSIRLESNTKNRPLLRDKKGKSLESFIEAQLSQRQPFYEKALYRVNNEREHPQATVEEIINILKNKYMDNGKI